MRVAGHCLVPLGLRDNSWSKDWCGVSVSGLEGSTLDSLCSVKLVLLYLSCGFDSEVDEELSYR